MPRKSFANQANCPRIDGLSKCAVRDAPNGVLEPPALTELTDQCAACRVNVPYVFSTQMNVSPSFQFHSQRPVVRFEERPIQVIVMSHPQFPSNSGFCFSTKA